MEMNHSLSPLLQKLPGVSRSLTQAAKNVSTVDKVGAPQEFVFEGSGATAQSKQRLAHHELEFKHDLKQHRGLADQLRELGTPPDPRGLARLVGLINRHPQPFTQALDAARDVTLSLGKNPGALTRLQSTREAFANTSSMAPNQMGDLNYILARIATQESQHDNAAVRQSIRNQLEGNLKLLDALKRYESQLSATLDQMGPNTKGAYVVESDFRLNGAGEVERVQDAHPNGEIKGDAEVKLQGGQFVVDPSTKGGDSIKADGFATAQVNMSNRPKVVYMNREGLLDEIRETRQMIRGIERASKRLETRPASAQPLPMSFHAGWFHVPQGPRGG